VSQKSEPADINAPLTVEPNADYVDQLYQQWLEEPAAVSRDWQIFFHSHQGE
jgi:2-oxoglutarate dehydrogenase complex dehydrogenase (E1) component-like enzyme